MQAQQSPHLLEWVGWEWDRMKESDTMIKGLDRMDYNVCSVGEDYMNG